MKFIAEIGENHGGDKNLALEMLRKAAQTGVDYVKFQSYSVDDLNSTADADTRSWIEKTQLSEQEHQLFKTAAERYQVEFLSTAVNIRWAKYLKSIGCQTIKLASLSLVNTGLLEYVGENFKTVFLSTGMGDLLEIKRALTLLGSKPEVTVLHCVSEYPTRDERANLNSIPYLKEHLNCAVGYSDHTIGTAACLAAAALGASLIEKHFTLDKTSEGSDHILSADPAEMAEIVFGCKRIEKQLGTACKEPNETERSRREAVRQLFVPDESIHAAN